MIQSGDVIRHKTFKDVCCLVKASIGNVFYVSWINMGYTKSWFLPIDMECLYTDDFTEWEICLDPDPLCYRYAAWRSL